MGLGVGSCAAGGASILGWKESSREGGQVPGRRAGSEKPEQEKMTGRVRHRQHWEALPRGRPLCQHPCCPPVTAQLTQLGSH